MRFFTILPVAAAFALAACGSSEPEQADGEMSLDEAARAAGEMVQPLPGQYRSTIELLEFDVPGVPDQLRSQMQAAAASGFAEGNSFCLTEQEAAEGPQRMVENMAESNCTFASFDVNGGSVNAVMNCSGEGGIEGQVTLAGTMSQESSTMTMDMDQEIPGAGTVSMKMRVDSERTGDCT